MKKYIYIPVLSMILALAVTQTSCSDFLDQKPQGEWIKGDYSGGTFDTYVYSLYSQARSYSVTSGINAMGIHFFRSEDADVGTTVGDGAKMRPMYDNFQYDASNPELKPYWSDNFQMIHNANRLIDTINQVSKTTKLTDADLINKAEAHMFRAFGYFNLVRAFGEVPLVDFKVTKAEQANVPKSSIDKIYQLIDADLTEAEKLPDTWPSENIGRFTHGAARALHAKTYMQRNDWTNMYKAATDVINSNIYNLNTPFDKIFREEGENSSESVLELQCTARNGIDKNKFGSQFAEVQGVRGSGQWDLGWGWHTPNDLLAAAFEEGDPRKDETLLYFAKSENEAQNMTPNKPYNEMPVVTQDVINKYYNKKVYTNPKYREEYGDRHGGWVNIRLIRYADVVLMAAESANELGMTGEALKYLEMVRARARGNNTGVLPQVTTTNQTELRKAIQHERRIELAMEFDRFYDLVRWGIAKEVLHAAGKTGYQDKHKYLPIPQSEIDKSNGVLIQNPNY